MRQRPLFHPGTEDAPVSAIQTNDKQHENDYRVDAGY
jgi:hypothetical protein